MSIQYITLLAKYHHLCYVTHHSFTMPAMKMNELRLYLAEVGKLDFTRA